MLKDGGQPIAHMDDDSKMLGYYSVESGMEIHIIDTDPFSQITTKALEDTSQSESVSLSNKTYEQRKTENTENKRKKCLNQSNVSIMLGCQSFGHGMHGNPPSLRLTSITLE